jgi:hypothetical protein
LSSYYMSTTTSNKISVGIITLNLCPVVTWLSDSNLKLEVG